MPKRVNFLLITRLVHMHEGLYQTATSLEFQGKGYEESELVEVLGSDVLEDYPNGAVIVPAIATFAIFNTIDNSQTGAAVEGEPPKWELIDGMAYDADTGELLDPTTF